MTFDERLAAIRANMRERKLDVLVAVHDGAHFIETPNPVFVLSLRVGASDGCNHGIVSAMLAVHDRGNDVLWSSPGAMT